MNATWETNRKLLTDLWPSYEPTEAERDLFRESLAKHDQNAVQEAIRDIRRSCDRDYKPVLSEIIHAVRQRVLSPGQRGDGHDYERLATEVARDRVDDLAAVQSWSIDRRKAAIDFARNAVMIDAKTILVDKPHLWPKTLLAIIVAVDWMIANQPEKAEAIRRLGVAPRSSEPAKTPEQQQACIKKARQREMWQRGTVR